MSPGFEIAAADPFAAPQSRSWACWVMALTPVRWLRQAGGLLPQHGSKGNGSSRLRERQPGLQNLAPGSSTGAVALLSAVPPACSPPQSGTFRNEKNSCSLGGREKKKLYTLFLLAEKKKVFFSPGQFLYWCIHFNHLLGQKYYTLTYFRKDTYLKDVLKSYG